MSSSFRVSQDNPLNVNIMKLLRSDLTSVCSKAVHGTVLSSDFNVLLFFSKKNSNKVKIDRSDNDI